MPQKLVVDVHRCAYRIRSSHAYEYLCGFGFALLGSRHSAVKMASSKPLTIHNRSLIEFISEMNISVDLFPMLKWNSVTIFQHNNLISMCAVEFPYWLLPSMKDSCGTCGHVTHHTHNLSNRRVVTHWKCHRVNYCNFRFPMQKSLRTHSYVFSHSRV